MLKYKFSVLFLLFCLLSISAYNYVFADNFNEPPVKVQISAYGSNEKSQRGLFTTDFIVPLYYPQNKDTLAFFNPKYTYTTPEADEINLGIGLRHIFDDSFILGLNTFFDRRLSHSGKWYSQAGLGLEYLSHPLDIRLNWYKPLTRAKIINTTYGFGSTSLIQYDNKEEPLQGLDFEFGVPVFDQYTKTRLFLGGFFYQSRLSKDVNGFRARTETSLTNWLSLDTTFDSKSDGQSKFYGGARIILPFEWTNLFRKNSKTGASVTPDTNSYLENHIFDRVIRDIDIQSTTSATQSKVHDMTYVDNSNSTPGSGEGTFENPYKTIQNGIDNAIGDKWVYIRKGNGSYLEEATVKTGTTLWGSGYNGDFSGISAPGYPVINGTGKDNALTLLGNNTIMGINVTGANNFGIFAQDADNIFIHNNEIIGNGVGDGWNSGLGLIFIGGVGIISSTAGNYNTNIAGNIIQNNALNNVTGLAAGIATLFIDGTVNLNIDSNFIISNGNNNSLNGGAGIINLFIDGISEIIITSNTINDNGNNCIDAAGAGILSSDFGPGQVNMTISTNTITKNGNDGSGDDFSFAGGIVYFGQSESSGGNIALSLLSNTITDNGNRSNGTSGGFIALNIGSSPLSIIASSNTINRNGLNSLDSAGTYTAAGEGRLSLLAEYNTITDNENGFKEAFYDADVELTTIDLGGGILESAGHNSIYDNTTLDIVNNTSSLLTAKHNWWGTSNPDPISQFSGNIDYEPFLLSPPNP
ncbi:MAG: inverse autotransporter beta domain-containing protein [Candidatus Omnitrophota bacterium]